MPTACAAPTGPSFWREPSTPRLLTEAIEVHDLAHRAAGGRAVLTPRPTQRHDATRSHVGREPERAPGGASAPERKGDERRAKAHGACGEQQVLHARIDRAVERRHRDLG